MSNVTIQQHVFLFAFNNNYKSILYRFQDKASYMSKVADFSLYLTPSLKGTY